MPYFSTSDITGFLDNLKATYINVSKQLATYTSVEEITVSQKKLAELREEMTYWEHMLDERQGSGGTGLRVIRMRQPTA